MSNTANLQTMVLLVDRLVDYISNNNKNNRSFLLLGAPMLGNTGKWSVNPECEYNGDPNGRQYCIRFVQMEIMQNAPREEQLVMTDEGGRTLTWKLINDVRYNNNNESTRMLRYSHTNFTGVPFLDSDMFGSGIIIGKFNKDGAEFEISMYLKTYDTKKFEDGIPEGPYYYKYTVKKI